MWHKANNAFPWYWPFGLGLIGLVFLTDDHAFFWDGITQGSKAAHWFYEQGFQTFLLPPELDAGHPPAFGIYLAFCWQLFGKTLAVSHWAMLPFLFGILIQTAKLAEHLFEDQKGKGWALSLVFANPVLLSQCTLVSPDIPLLFGFLLGLRAILAPSRRWLAPALLILLFISLRGILLAGALFLMDAWHFYRNEQFHSSGKALSKVVPYLVSGGAIAIWFAVHHAYAGWWFSTPNPEWRAHREVVNFMGLLRNGAILAWRLADFGNVALWGALVYLLWRNRRALSSKCIFFLLAALLPILTLLPIALLSSNPLGHRYLLPAFTVAGIALGFLISTKVQASRLLGSVVILTLLTGNLWVYPRHIAQGWDATLGHLPYYQLRKTVMQDILKEGISPKEVGTRFPCAGPWKYIDLTDDTRGFQHADLSRHRYVLYANVMNDFTDAERETLEKQWKAIRTYRQWPVVFVLYQNSGEQ